MNLSSRFEYKFSGYCSSYYNNYIYYGTNQGLIRAKFHNEKIHSNAKIENIINSDGQVWRLEIVNNNLYCCHHRGLFILSNNRLEPVYTNDGVWALSQITEEEYLVGTYSGFKLLNTKTNEINSIGGYNISTREFEYQASTNSAWLLTSKGVEKITFSEDFTKAASKLVWESNRFDAHLININNKIILITPEKVFNILNTGELEETDEYNNLIAQKGEECNIKIDKFKNLWYIYPDKLEIRYYDNRFAKYEERRYTLLNNSNYLIEGFTEAKNINNRYAIVNNIYGYSLIDITQKNKINLKKSPIFSQIYTTNHIDSLIYVGSHIAKDTTLTLKQRENSVKFILGVNSSNIGNGKFSYKLDGRDKNWSEWSNNNRVEYHNLFEGNYKLIVRYIDNDGKVTENNIAIKVLPPWYRTILFYIFCTLLFSTLSIYIIWWIKRRYNNAKKRIILEKENEIIRLENEKLESDIKNKSAELSNLLLTRVDKNDIITTVKKELEKLLEDVIKEKGENATKRIMSLNRKLDEKLQDNIDWEYFEENFNLLNDNFVNKLTAYCDSVTINERKLCVYINMGLQNKEIAPLLNISVRGVEMLRYRIRKKLKIERNDSLSEFLNSL